MRSILLALVSLTATACADAQNVSLSQTPPVETEIVSLDNIVTPSVTSYVMGWSKAENIKPYNLYHSLEPKWFDFGEAGIVYYYIPPENRLLKDGSWNFGFLMFGTGDIGGTPVTVELWIDESFADSGLQICSYSSSTKRAFSVISATDCGAVSQTPTPDRGDAITFSLGDHFSLVANNEIVGRVRFGE